MQIVSDRGMDLAETQLQGLDIHLAPLLITLAGKTYRSGIDIQPDEFYRLLEQTDQFPTTAQPSVGDLADIYRRLAATDPEIISFHISSGLSGTINAARLAAQQVPEAHVTFVDTQSLSGEQGWQVEAAARAIKAGWSKEQVLALVERVRAGADAIFTVPTLRYLIHGGRISHLKGMLGSILNIKPIIGVDKTTGKYEQLGQARTMKQAFAKMTDIVASQHAPGTPLRAQIFHGHNDEGAEQLRATLDQRFPCTWGPTAPIAPVLGAHTGPGLVALIYGPQATFTEVPQ